MTDITSDLNSEDFQKWLNDMTSIDTTGYGNDSTPIQQSNAIADYIASHPLDQNSLLLQQWILGKESGLQTRSAMAYGAVYVCARVLESIQLYNDLYSRQSDVEQRMTKTEGDFQKVIANATVDSEVILARSSDTYGDYKTLDARLENDEKILAQFAPIGFRVTINHGLGINPKLTVYSYQDAIGTETNGLGTAPTGLGETGTQTVPILASYPDADTLVVDMPANYKLNGTPQPALDGDYYLIDGNKTLKFDIGGLQKPKPNLLTGTSGPFVMGGSIPNTTWDTANQVSGISLPVTIEIWPEVLPQGAGFPYTYIPGVTYTQSIYISTDAPLTGTPISLSWFTDKYAHDTRGSDNLVKVSTNVYRATSTYTWPSSNSPANGRTVDLYNLTQVFDFTKGTFLNFYKPKLELNSVPTAYVE